MCFGICLSLIVATLVGRETASVPYTDVPFLQTPAEWADSIMSTMDLDEKVGQLILAQHPASESAEIDSMLTGPISMGHVGGIVFQNHSMQSQVAKTHLYQRISKTPLWIAVEHDTLSLEYNQVPNDLSLVAIDTDSIIQDLGESIGRQSRDVGIHLQFTPTLEHSYSYLNRKNTIHKLLRVQRGIQKHQVLSCSRYIHLQQINQADSLAHDSLLYPYQEMIRSGVSGMFVDLQTAYGTSSADTPMDINHYLRNKLQFSGVVFAEMPDSSTQVSNYVRKAIQRGVDVFVAKNHVPLVASTLRDMVRNRDLGWDELDRKVRKVLLAKAWSQAPNHHRYAKNHLTAPSVSRALSLMNRSLIKQSVTLVTNEKNRIPIQTNGERDALLLTIGKPLSEFNKLASLYTSVTFEQIDREPYRPLNALSTRKLARYRPVIIALNELRIDVIADADFMKSLQELRKRTEVILVNFSDPQWLAPLADFPNILQVYNNAPISQQIAAQSLFGGEAIAGKLPVSVSQSLAYGAGQATEQMRLNYTYPEAAGMISDSLYRIEEIVQDAIEQRAMPGCQVMVIKSGQVVYNEAFGYHTYDAYQPVKQTDLYDLASLTKIAATTMAAMRMYDEKKLDPEASLASYFRNQGVYLHTRTLLDTAVADTLLPTEILPTEADSSGVASARRTMASPFMKTANFSATHVVEEEPDTVAVEAGEAPPLPISRRAIKKSVWLERAPVFDVNLTDLMTHRSGLQAAMPILPFIEYRDSLTGRFDRYFQETRDSLFSIQVADNFFLRNDYRDSIWQSTKRLRVFRKDYEYSDVNMVLLQQAIDSINQISIDQYLDSVIYGPLGLSTIRFNPTNTLPKERLIPTELDRRWRGQLLHGYVHDPTAALLGGISGNAGLFSNANDLGILFQMVLNRGEYAGRRYLNPSTIRKFTAATQGHRGLGFDKPPQNGGYIIGANAPMSSYGHTGFTGTCVWVDPDNELVYVFLSNRVHPSAKNWRINTLRVRQRIHDAIYNSLQTAGGLNL